MYTELSVLFRVWALPGGGGSSTLGPAGRISESSAVSRCKFLYRRLRAFSLQKCKNGKIRNVRLKLKSETVPRLSNCPKK